MKAGGGGWQHPSLGTLSSDPSDTGHILSSSLFKIKQFKCHSTLWNHEILNKEGGGGIKLPRKKTTFTIERKSRKIFWTNFGNEQMKDKNKEVKKGI